MAVNLPNLEVRTVNRENLKDEFLRVRKFLEANPGSYVAVDTEFPGTVEKPKKPYFEMTVQENYDCMRKNVNDLKLIQLGLTVCNAFMEVEHVWEFNFNDFDLSKDKNDPKSIMFLKRHGVDFAKNQKDGVSEVDFRCFLEGLIDGMHLKWVFFHCTYDLGYLIKILTQKPLPERVDDFMALVRYKLGGYVFDVKEMVRCLPLHPSTRYDWNSGLDKVAQNLGLVRMVGRSHQAGSDSLLALRCFKAVKHVVKEEEWSYQLHGLPWPPQPQPQAVYVSYYYQAAPPADYQVQEHPQFVTPVNPYTTNYIVIQ